NRRATAEVRPARPAGPIERHPRMRASWHRGRAGVCTTRARDSEAGGGELEGAVAVEADVVERVDAGRRGADLVDVIGRNAAAEGAPLGAGDLDEAVVGPERELVRDHEGDRLEDDVHVVAFE